MRAFGYVRLSKDVAGTTSPQRQREAALSPQARLSPAGSLPISPVSGLPRLGTPPGSTRRGRPAP
jgi:hypothetical protein